MGPAYHSECGQNDAERSLSDQNHMEMSDIQIFTRFVLEHENDDTARLMLSRDRWKGIDTEMAVNTIISRKKIKDKVPSWYSEPGLLFPKKLSAEQCSSENTAIYKARLAAVILEEARPACGRKWKIADLTGGLGVDSWAFSYIAGEVLYNEMDPDLAAAARHNFGILGCRGITVSEAMAVPRGKAGDGDTAAVTPEVLLGEFGPDLIFMDPARRDDQGKKVFMISDCRPDVLALKDELLEISRFLLIKLSPMADIDLAVSSLGHQCREVHVVASGGECKELDVLMDREWRGECRITACEISGGREPVYSTFSFTRSEEKEARAAMLDSPEDISGGAFLFEPGKALSKSGAFSLISSRSGMKKLARSTHLYVTGEIPGEMSGLGKTFRISSSSPLNNRSIKETGKASPKADVTARNIPLSSDALRQKMKITSGGDRHIFGAGCEFGGKNEPYLIIAERI